VFFLVKALLFLLDRPWTGFDVEGVLGDFSGDAQHFYQDPRKDVPIASEEVDELAFLFGVQTGPDLHGFGRGFGIDLYGLGILVCLQKATCQGHGQAEWCCGYPEVELPLFGRGDRNGGQLDAVLLTVQHPLHLGLHGDDLGGCRNLDLEVEIAGDGHELDITRPPQDDVVRPGEVYYLKCEHLVAIVGHVSEGDRQGDSPERDGLFP
jgi:hypothetical protein